MCVLLHTAQAELSELRSLVESLTRKNRHLAEELSEANRAQDMAHTQLLGLQVRLVFFLFFVCVCVCVVLLCCVDCYGVSCLCCLCHLCRVACLTAAACCCSS